MNYRIIDLNNRQIISYHKNILETLRVVADNPEKFLICESLKGCCYNWENSIYREYTEAKSKN